MFIGHFAAGLASKKASPALSLALMFIAVQFLDLLWPILVMLGIETVSIEAGITKLTPLNFTYYPYSHSLLMAIIWGIVFGLVYFMITKKGQNAILLGALVVSHWVLDLIVHRPDLPLTPFGETKLGFGMWNYPLLEIIVELSLFFTGIYLYRRAYQPDRKIAFWLLIAVFLVIYFANFFGPLPPDPMSVAIGANFIWLFILWAWWIERSKNNAQAS